MKSKLLFLPAVLATFLAMPAAYAQATWSQESATELLGVVERAGDEGLDAKDYDAGGLRAALANADGLALQRSANEIFLHLAADFTRGHVRNRAAVGWHLEGPKFDEASGQRLMSNALSGGGVRATLEGLLPQHRQYLALKGALTTIPPRDKAGSQRIRANLERWRWMPRDLGRRYLLVNVPAFTVSVVEDQRVITRWRVIVGKAATPTPQFAATVSGVILNPWWDIPTSIVRESIGRLVATAPAQARQKGYVVSHGRYRQQPGPENALGRIKLVMPNPFTVYLHDTPNQALFDAEIRAFSHGCVRTQDPLGLAEELLTANGGWERARLDGVIAGGRMTQVALAQPLPIYITYFTMAEVNGELATFSDIYGRDPAIVAALIDHENATAP